MKSNLSRFSIALAVTVLATWCLASVRVAESGTLDEGLEPLRHFLGKTWRGEFKDSKPDKPTIDVARWERALNGKAVRILHSINDGAYGGESLLIWDKQKSEIRYHYFTTAGFHTVGSMSVVGSKITAVEKVAGNSNMTEVRSTFELRDDGTMLNKSEYLKDGKPSGSREVLYREDPKAEVKFK